MTQPDTHTEPVPETGARQEAADAPTLRQRIADLLVDRCPDHGCVEPEWSACHCELDDDLVALFAAERADAQAEAAAILRRTPSDSRDYPAVLTGARVIEDHLRARAATDAGAQR